MSQFMSSTAMKRTLSFLSAATTAEQAHKSKERNAKECFMKEAEGMFTDDEAEAERLSGVTIIRNSLRRSHGHSPAGSPCKRARERPARRLITAVRKTVGEFIKKGR